jgi:hypothetical protein
MMSKRSFTELEENVSGNFAERWWNRLVRGAACHLTKLVEDILCVLTASDHVEEFASFCGMFHV